MPLLNILLLNQHAVGGANLLVSIITQPVRPFRRKDRLPVETLPHVGTHGSASLQGMVLIVALQLVNVVLQLVNVVL
jgi:hypothetical protein